MKIKRYALLKCALMLNVTLAFCAPDSLTTQVSCSQERIVKPDDAPQALPAEESTRRIKVPDGFRVELVASEPLVREPSGVCWDEFGRLFVCELHGYNLEGQYDIEDLNKTGELDRVVRRIQANDNAKEAAKPGTYGTVKLLLDSNGDGRMDKAVVWADRLPPCYGLCPARGGIIVACAPDIVFLADRDGDGKAETLEKLFAGFATGALERGLNAPQWGPDGWIYFGGGHGGGKITGSRLPHPVELPNTDFRIKPDGSAIEPVSGRTHTFGFTFTESADRFVITTRAPLFVAPLPWRYLARNPDAAAPQLESAAISDPRIFPISSPHPWRTRRAEDPGFAKYYTDRYGVQESAPNGFFTSACSPLVYQDLALPGLRGQLLVCEPAQNLIHRAILERTGPRLVARRAAGEEQSEFLASTDAWFHPMALAHGPDGALWIVDFYREIIEDYSAIPRYLQQLYGLTNGQEHGRIYRLIHQDMPPAPSAVMDRLTVDQLVAEVGSPYLWRRQTARRLLVERRAQDTRPGLEQILRESPEQTVVLNALATLDALGLLDESHLIDLLSHPDSAVRVQAMRLADQRLAAEPALLEAILSRLDDPQATVQLQVALSLGESRDARVVPALARLAREHGDISWLHDAILSSLSARGSEMLAELFGDPRDTQAAAKPAALGLARGLLEPLCTAIAARREPRELSDTVIRIAALTDPALQADCLKGIRRQFRETTHVVLADAARDALKSLASSSHTQVRSTAQSLVVVMRVESTAERLARLDTAARQVVDQRAPIETRLAAVAQLATENDPQVTAIMLNAFSTGTPQIRDAILSEVFARRDRLPAVVESIEKHIIPASALSALQRRALLEHAEVDIRQRAARLLASSNAATDENMRRYFDALKNPRDMQRGERVFREACAKCHQAHGVGIAVGPDLTAEFQRAEETIIRDIVAPSAAIASGYVTYIIEVTDGQVLTGLIASESANSLLLRQPEGKEQSVLRKEIELLKASPVSIMPEDLIKTLQPQDVADCIAWLRRPPDRMVLLDDDPAFASTLTEGDGTATFITSDAYHGLASLRVTPLQKHSPRIRGWAFRIRQNPGPGEFRYLRFAWKTEGGHGVLIELANDGQWPPADAARFRYFAGRNTTDWKAVEVSPEAPSDWTMVTRDLWKDFGDSTLTGIAPTALGGVALFDSIELIRHLDGW